MTQQPATVSPPVQERPAQGQRAQGQASGGCAGGCLKGCGITLLALAAILVLAFVWAAIWGRPFLAARLPAWEAQQPLLTPLLDYSGLRARLMPEPDAQQLREELQQGRVQGNGDRNLVPNDIPLYEQPLAEAFSVSATEATGYQQVDVPPDDVRARLLDEMGIQGWELIEERAVDDGGVQLFWTKGERTCQMDILHVDDLTEVWLRSSGTP
ncbi:MAG: hypothetical protein R6X16_03115 [Anaerolineae bacterium]